MSGRAASCNMWPVNEELHDNCVIMKQRLVSLCFAIMQLVKQQQEQEQQSVMCLFIIC